MTEDKILQVIKEHIEQSENYLTEHLDQFMENYKIYDGEASYYKNLMPKLFKLEPHFVSQEVKDVIEWVMPSLMRIFFGAEDVITIKGRTPEDDKPAKLMSAVINWQINRLNPGFKEIYKWFKSALITGSFLKVWWERVYVTKTETIVLKKDEIEGLKNKGYKILKQTRVGESDYYEVEYSWEELDKEYPKMKHLRIDEVIVSPLSDEIADNPFVAHRFVMTRSKLKELEKMGIYENVDKVFETKNFTERELLYKIWGEDPNYQISDRSLDRVVVYECYVKIDIDGDGIAEDYIITIANDVILRKEQNPYGRPPLFYLAPILKPHSLYGEGLAELLKDIQFLKTAFIKLAIINSKYQIEPKYLVNPAYVNIEDIQNDRAFIRVNTTGGDLRQHIIPLPSQPLSGAFFSMLEYLFIERENRTGITRYNQGVGISRNSINRTATAVSLMVQQSAQRIELIARIFAETGFKEFIEFLIYLNSKFLTKDIQLRLTNEIININPDDLKGQFDFRINIGSTDADKQVQIATLKELLANFVPMLIELGLTDVVKIRQMFYDFLKLIGFTDPDKYLYSEQELEVLLNAKLRMSENTQQSANSTGGDNNS